MTVLALAVGVPFLARLPSTVMTLPTLRLSRFQPLRARMFGVG
jgi:hypothetical protein